MTTPTPMPTSEQSLITAVMNKNIVCVAPDTLMIDVIHKMRDNRYSCMVVAENNSPVGIITERDMVRILSEIFAQKTVHADMRAAQCMSYPPIVIKESASLFEALVIARARGIRHLPVVNDQDQLCGLITQSDMMRAHLVLIEQHRELIEKLVNERTQELEKANEKLRALSLEDGLLGIGNRRAMEADLDHTHATAQRYKRPYAVALFDIDFFKNYNDHYGHPAGDQALIQVCRFVQSRIRTADRLYRYGGEELLLLLPETTAEGARIMAERLVTGLAELQIRHDTNPHRYVTMSGGIGYLEGAHARCASWQDIALQADQSLYQAKQAGRNQVKLTLIEDCATLPQAKPAAVSRKQRASTKNR